MNFKKILGSDPQANNRSAALCGTSMVCIIGYSAGEFTKLTWYAVMVLLFCLWILIVQAALLKNE